MLLRHSVYKYTLKGEAVINAIMDKAEKTAMSAMNDNVFKPTALRL